MQSPSVRARGCSFPTRTAETFLGTDVQPQAAIIIATKRQARPLRKPVAVSHLLTSLAMSLLRPSIARAARPARIATTSFQTRRPLSSSQPLRSAEGSHEEHYDPPGGWLWGIKPGEKSEKEGWENILYYGFFGSLAFGVIGYCYKPDTRYA